MTLEENKAINSLREEAEAIEHKLGVPVGHEIKKRAGFSLPSLPSQRIRREKHYRQTRERRCFGD